MARFEGQDLTGAEFRECDLTRARLIGVVMRDAVIDGLVDNLVVNGVEVTSYVEAELDRRHPVRVLVRSSDPSELREAHRQLCADWAATVERLREMPRGSEHQRVGGEWSAWRPCDTWCSCTTRDSVAAAGDLPSRSRRSGWRPTSLTRTRRDSIERRTRASTRCCPCARGRPPSWGVGWRASPPRSCRRPLQCRRDRAGRRMPEEGRCSSACTRCWTSSGHTTASASATSTYSRGDHR